jgi:hypothetical protein
MYSHATAFCGSVPAIAMTKTKAWHANGCQGDLPELPLLVYTKYRATGEPIGDAPVFDYGPVQTQDIATYCEVTG